MSDWPAMTTKRCAECGLQVHRSYVEDGWCARCRGEKPEPFVFRGTPYQEQDEDWMLLDCKHPGVKAGPWTFRRAVVLAQAFGGRVRPWVESKEGKTSVYPHPGRMQRAS